MRVNKKITIIDNVKNEDNESGRKLKIEQKDRTARHMATKNSYINPSTTSHTNLTFFLHFQPSSSFSIHSQHNNST